MQWLINEFKDFKAEVFKRIDEAVDKWALSQIEAAEKFAKLEGEIKAMKARMGKQKHE
jgi:hypothetical protein